MCKLFAKQFVGKCVNETIPVLSDIGRQLGVEILYSIRHQHTTLYLIIFAAHLMYM